ncbi:12113_t:CDS:2 [Rhizophagus irregularis]|nr:12113_t:CDS:2 [Rhizophagus irregularis]
MAPIKKLVRKVYQICTNASSIENNPLANLMVAGDLKEINVNGDESQEVIINKEELKEVIVNKKELKEVSIFREEIGREFES